MHKKEPNKIKIDVQKIIMVRCPKCGQWMHECIGINEYSTTAECILCDVYVQLKWNIPVYMQIPKMSHSC